MRTKHIPRIVTSPSAELESSAAGPIAGTVLTPHAPVSIPLYDVWSQPHTVPFKAVLKPRDERTNRHKVNTQKYVWGKKNYFTLLSKQNETNTNYCMFYDDSSC